MTLGTIYYAEALAVLTQLPTESVDLIYIDPPFNTGKLQRYTRLKTIRAEDGERVGFGGARYKALPLDSRYYPDKQPDYLGFLELHLKEAHRVLASHGTLYVHLDWREVHYCKVFLDGLFGRKNFLNEIIWAYDYGGRSFRRWPAKHDNILVYVKDPKRYIFCPEEVDRLPYLAPGLVTPEKAARGKFPTDVWWHTIVPTHGKERTGYPTQKPVGILKRIIAASSKPGALVLDFFAGSGTTGVAALALGRRFILVDNNPQALEVMAKRFYAVEGIEWIGFNPHVA